MSTINVTDWLLDFTPTSFSGNSFTNGNRVNYYIDGRGYMQELQDLLNGSIDDTADLGLVQGDFFLFGAWVMDPDIQLRPPPDHPNLFDTLKAALLRYASVRLLLFTGMPAPSASIFSGSTSHRAIQHRWMELGDYGGEVIMDTIGPTFGSCHQKYGLIGKKQVDGTYILTAFCGGIDLNHNRADTPSHLVPLGFGDLWGWHDIHSKIEGPAAEQILQDFASRWNYRSEPAYYTKTETTHIDLDSLPVVLPADTEGYLQNIQLLNTYPCETTFSDSYNPSYYSFATNGIRTIEEGYINAINQAQHYIYIENLFFLHEPVSEAIASNLRTKRNLKVIIVVIYLGYGPLFGERYYESNQLDILKSAAQDGQLYICDLRHPTGSYHEIADTVTHSETHSDNLWHDNLYVHSKVMIVDDIYVTIGSANLTPRSMSYDQEINVAIVDGDQDTYSVDNISYQVCKFARDFRVELWQEHLQLDSNAQLLTIPDALQTWVENITYAERNEDFDNRAPSRVFNHDPTKMGARMGNPLLFWSVKHPSLHCD